MNPMTEHRPAAFVWTKIQAEAGETLDRILGRKELERLAGNGSFWWGIGESKARAIRVLAGKQPAKPNTICRSLTNVVNWKPGVERMASPQRLSSLKVERLPVTTAGLPFSK
jgi:hypothetical protein